MNVLLIDFSALAARCWHHMRAPGYQASSNSEEIEWVRNLATAATIIKDRFRDYYIVVAADSHSWRHEYWKESYLKSALELSSMDGRDLIAFKDGYYYRMNRMDNDTWSAPHKLTKAEMPVTLGEVPVDDPEVIEHLKEFLGYYKGSRMDSTWKFSTPKEEYKKWRSTVAPKWASIVGGQYASVMGAEADDIIASATIRLAAEGHKVVILSTDQDLAWSEKKGYGQLHDMAWSLESWDENLRKPIDTDSVVKNMVMKILVGDDGDDIGPVLTKAKARITPTRGPLSAEKLVEMGNLLVDCVDPLSWERNFTLMWLRDPGPIEDFIQEELNNPRPDAGTPFSFWELPDHLRMIAEAQGRAWAERDRNPENWL